MTPPLPDGKTESETDRDGILSYAGEWHALVLGLGAGVASALVGQPAIAAAVVAGALGIKLRRFSPVDGTALDELEREPWYAIAGVLAGYAVATVGVV